MTTNTSTNLDEQITAAERDLDTAQARWRNRPRGAPIRTPSLKGETAAA